MIFIHSGSLGDIVYSLPTILSMCERHGQRAKLYLKTGVRADYYQGAVHPAGQARMDVRLATSLLPLLRGQPVFDEVELWQRQPIDVDLDLMRATGIDYGRGCISRWYFYAFHANYDLSLPWLTVPNPESHGRVVVGRTSRYRNPRINYRFLNEYKPLFLGLKEEWEEFRTGCPAAEWRPTKDLLEAAQVIAGSKVFLGNQSVLYSIAEAIKCPRVLEVCLHAPNVIPHGLNGWDCVNQIGLESVATELINLSTVSTN